MNPSSASPPSHSSYGTTTSRHRGSRQLRRLRRAARDAGRDRRARRGAARVRRRRSRSCRRSGTSSPTPSRRRCTRSSSRCHVRTRVTSPTSWRVRSSTPRTAGRSSASRPGTAPAQTLASGRVRHRHRRLDLLRPRLDRDCRRPCRQRFPVDDRRRRTTLAHLQRGAEGEARRVAIACAFCFASPSACFSAWL